MKIDNKALQEFQKEFCIANHLYCSCLSGDNEIIARDYGTIEEQDFLGQYVDKQRQLEMIRSLSVSVAEDVIEEDTECGFVKLYALAVRIESELVAVWLVKGVIKELIPEGTALPENIRIISQKDFYHAVKFLYISSKQYFKALMQLEQAKKAAEKNSQDKQRAEEDLRRSEAMSNVVQMLESDREFEQIVEEIMKIVCEYLEISGTTLLQMDADTQLIDMICEWHTQETDCNIADYQGLRVEELPFWKGRPYMISSNSMMPEEFRIYFEKEKIKAGIFLPIEVNRKVVMYMSFTENDRERIWDIMDIKFLNNVKKVIQSILAKRINKDSLAGSYASLEAILENVGCGVCVKDFEKQQILYTNECFRSFFRNDTEDESAEIMLWKPEKEVPLEKNICSELYLEEEDRWFDIHHTEIVWVNGKTVSLYTVYDITDNKRYQQKIERQANSDFLTGLYNRMRCEEDLAKYIRQSKEMNGEGALLYIDLDDFKHINDGLGHRYGDVLLRAISHSLQRIQGIESNCYRMGGDEFIIIVTQYQYAMLNRILCDIQDIFAKPWFLKGADYYCTMSMGIVRFPGDGENVQELIQKADLAMYEAKKAGKNRSEFYHDNVEATSVKRLDMEKNMRDATLNDCDEFEVYYQPIFDVTKEGNSCAGAEALIRWNSKSLGFISPVDFIPLAEYLGLINPIGTFVLKKACERCKYWNDMGHPEYKVNVNLSVVQLLQNDIVEKVAKVLKETGINPSNLTLEVTESLAVNDMARMKRILGMIKELGVRVALDDFGTGYSSLNHIREMPIDVIKIDRCFVMDIGKDEFADIFVKVVGELAETIGMHLCVEGVEVQEQFDRLKNMKIELIQGFYFDEPLTVEEFERKYL